MIMSRVRLPQGLTMDVKNNEEGTDAIHEFNIIYANKN